MDITVNRAKRSRRLLVRPDFSHNLYFYKLPPIQNIKLQAFEEYANDRIKILKVLEKLGRQFGKGSLEHAEAMRTELNNATKEGSLKNFFRKSDHLDIHSLREADNTSHFILRIVYCRTSELRKWLTDQETDLFRFRFLQLSKLQVENFFQLNHLSYKPIAAEEKEEHKDRLIHSSYSVGHDNFQDTNYYKVRFTEVLDLVRSRQVLVKGGWAFVPQNDLVHSVANLFRSQLSKDLATMSRTLYSIADEQRIQQLISSLSTTDPSGQQYQSGSDRRITADMIEELSQPSMPLCMMELHRNLTTHHHIRHFARLQLGLFLKAVGLSLDESLAYWKKEFTKAMDSDKFYKQYAYNIRYNYGKEGKKIQGRPYGCGKVIAMNPPSAGDCHGCPYKNYDPSILKQKLKSLNITNEHVAEIADLAKQGQHQMACGRLFETTHPKHTGPKYITTHPNQYFDDSLKIRAGISISHSSGDVNKEQQSKVDESSLTKTPNKQKDVKETDMETDDLELAMVALT